MPPSFSGTATNASNVLWPVWLPVWDSCCTWVEMPLLSLVCFAGCFGLRASEGRGTAKETSSGDGAGLQGLMTFNEALSKGPSLKPYGER